MKSRTPIYGLIAEFDNPTDLVAAARRVHDYGYRNIDAYSPFPIHELDEAMGIHNRLPLLVLCGGLAGCVGGYLLQYWTTVIDYPIHIALTAVLGMLALNGLPMPYHPIFNVPRFALASRDRFFVCIEATDPQFERDATWRFLETLKPRSISEVPH
jgi:hypothetical protein